MTSPHKIVSTGRFQVLSVAPAEEEEQPPAAAPLSCCNSKTRKLLFSTNPFQQKDFSLRVDPHAVPLELAVPDSLNHNNLPDTEVTTSPLHTQLYPRVVLPSTCPQQAPLSATKTATRPGSTSLSAPISSNDQKKKKHKKKNKPPPHLQEVLVTGRFQVLTVAKEEEEERGAVERNALVRRQQTPVVINFSTDPCRVPDYRVVPLDPLAVPLELWRPEAATTDITANKSVTQKETPQAEPDLMVVPKETQSSSSSSSSNHEQQSVIKSGVSATAKAKNSMVSTNQQSVVDEEKTTPTTAPRRQKHVMISMATGSFCVLAPKKTKEDETTRWLCPPAPQSTSVATTTRRHSTNPLAARDDFVLRHDWCANSLQAAADYAPTERANRKTVVPMARTVSTSEKVAAGTIVPNAALAAIPAEKSVQTTQDGTPALAPARPEATTLEEEKQIQADAPKSATTNAPETIGAEAADGLLANGVEVQRKKEAEASKNANALQTNGPAVVAQTIAAKAEATHDNKARKASYATIAKLTQPQITASTTDTTAISFAERPNKSRQAVITRRTARLNGARTAAAVARKERATLANIEASAKLGAAQNKAETTQAPPKQMAAHVAKNARARDSAKSSEMKRTKDTDANGVDSSATSRIRDRKNGAVRNIVPVQAKENAAATQTKDAEPTVVAAVSKVEPEAKSETAQTNSATVQTNGGAMISAVGSAADSSCPRGLSPEQDPIANLAAASASAVSAAVAYCECEKYGGDGSETSVYGE